VDVHCWVFTKESFGELFEQIRQLGLIRLAIDCLAEPAEGSNEFFVTRRP